jgi:hypothetical protein
MNAKFNQKNSTNMKSVFVWFQWMRQVLLICIFFYREQCRWKLRACKEEAALHIYPGWNR